MPLAGQGGGTNGLRRLSVSEEFQIEAERLWRILSFDNLGEWLPSASIISAGAESVGAIRVFAIGKQEYRERLDSLDNAKRIYKYSLIGSMLPLIKYESKIAVSPIGDAVSKLRWSALFAVMPGYSECKVRDTLHQTYGAGLAAIRTAVEKSTAPK
jgi:hypothetical protein